MKPGLLEGVVIDDTKLVNDKLQESTLAHMEAEAAQPLTNAFDRRPRPL